jgi:hypothetical protein
MAEPDELDRSLALARQSLRGPAAMKARVRARLAQAPPATDTPSPLRAPGADAARRVLELGHRLLARRLPLGTVALLVGGGFGVGLWLGRQPVERPRDEPSTPLTSARAVGSAPGPGAAASGASLQGRGAVGAAGTPRAGGAEAPAETRAGAGLDGVTALGEEGDVPRVTGARPRTPAAHPARAMALPERGPERVRQPTATPTSASVTSAARETSKARSTSSATGRAVAGNDAAALTDDALAEEIALLERVERAIRAGEPNLALALLAELDREVAVAALPEERAAARVLALCVRAGARSHGSPEATEARASAERFLAASPASVYADRIASSCPSDDSSTHRSAGIEEAARAGH